MTSEYRVERWLAALVMSVPLIYMLTDHSWSPVIFNYSLSLILACVVYAVFWALLVGSYWRPVPRFVASVRSGTVLFAYTMIVALLGTEVLLAIIDERPNVTAVRLRGYNADPDVSYVYKPNYSQDVVYLEGVTKWRTNSQGVRADHDYGPKPAGVTRILAIGDSFTAALEVRLEDAWPAVLERGLNKDAAPGTKFEVINTGHAGYGNRQQLAWLRKYGDQFDPDMVVLAMTPNDITDNGWAPPGEYTAIDGYLASRGGTIEEKRIWSHRRRWFSLPGHIRRSRVWRAAERALLQRGGAPTLWRPAFHVVFNEKDRKLHELTEKLLLEIDGWIKARGGKFGIVLLTFREQIRPMAPGYAPDRFSRYWMRFGKQHGIPVTSNFDDVFNYPDPEKLFWRWDHHYNALGYKITAKRAIDLVRNEMLKK